jgi:hypothetical protein
MRALLPRLSLLLRGCAHLATLNALKKRARQPALTGVAFAVHRAQIKKFIAQCVPLFLLRKHALQRDRQFAKTRGLRPRSTLVVYGFREQAFAAARALVETRGKLLTEGACQCIKFAGVDFVSRVHY